MLFLSSLIVGNHAVCRIQNSLCGTVVLLQTNDAAIWKLRFKSQNILDGCATKPVNALVIVSNNAEIFVLTGQKRYQLILRMVGVLILVHQYIAITILIFF